MPYQRQLLILLKCDKDYDVVTAGAAALATKGGTQRDCRSFTVEVDPKNIDNTGRVVMPENWEEAKNFLRVLDTHNRIYILTHANSESPGTLQGLNAGEVATILLPFKGLVAKIGLIVCRAGATTVGGVNFAQQLANQLIGFNAIVSAYKVPVGIWTEEMSKKGGHPDKVGKKFAKHDGV